MHVVAQLLPQLGQRRLSRVGQQPGRNRPGDLLIEIAQRVDERTRLGPVDAAGHQLRKDHRQPAHQRLPEQHLTEGVRARPMQRPGDLITGELRDVIRPHQRLGRPPERPRRLPHVGQHLSLHVRQQPYPSLQQIMQIARAHPGPIHHG